MAASIVVGMQSTRGLTLVELMISATALAISATALAIVAGIVASVLGGGGSDNVEDEARAWASDLGIPVHTVSCIGADNDGDGYVSCTIIPTDGGDPLFVECVSTWGWGDGCRAPKSSVRRGR